MPSVILSPSGLCDHLMTCFERDPVVCAMIRSLPDEVVNVLVCLDGLPPEKRDLRQGQADGMDRMLGSFLRRMGKVASVELFSFEADPWHCEMNLFCAHIFWQAGSSGGNTRYLVDAIDHNRWL